MNHRCPTYTYMKAPLSLPEAMVRGVAMSSGLQWV